MMNNLALVVFSADINDDLWAIDDYLINKYWPNHPPIYLLTETKQYTNFNTINFNYPIDKWTMRIRKSLQQIEEEYIVFMCDDCFIQEQVNKELLKKCLNYIQEKDNLANVNFELSFDKKDINCEKDFLKYRPKGAYIRVSLLCGLWSKEKLIKVLSENCSPWKIEQKQNDWGYDYYILKDERIIHWLNDSPDMCGRYYSRKMIWKYFIFFARWRYRYKKIKRKRNI